MKRIHQCSRLISIALFAMQWTHAAIIIPGDGQTPGKTTSFPLLGHVSNFSGSDMFFSAAPMQPGPGTPNNFAISYLSCTGKKLEPMAPEKVTLNNHDDVGNPLFNQPVRFLALMEGENAATGQSILVRPAIVLETAPTRFYLLASPFGARKIVMQTHELGDAQMPAMLTSGVVGLAASSSFIFGAVGANGGVFGDIGSGIAVAKLGTITEGEEEEKKIVSTLSTVNAAVGGSGNRAAPLDVSSSQLAIGSNLAGIGQITAMHYSHDVGRLYIGLQVTAGALMTDGARAIVVAEQLDNGQLIIRSIVPSTVFDGAQNKIVGAVGANAQVSVHHLRTMRTSTALPYLIVAGGNGSPSTTRRQVFALPLVVSTNLSLIGMIADKNATPTDRFSAAGSFIERIISTPATMPADMPLETDEAARVGGGDLVNGDIVDMAVYNDTVFVTVIDPASGGGGDPDQVPGVFSSQAIFDASGKIISWTPWRRASGSVDRVGGVLIDAVTGRLVTLVGDDIENIDIIKRTQWSDGDPDGMQLLVQNIDTQFPQAAGGVTHFADFPLNTPGLLSITMNAVGGNGKLLLAQTGLQTGGTFVISNAADFSAIQEFNTGSISAAITAKMIALSGGALAEIGPICAVEIATNDEDQAWLIVGGIGGVAILSADDGSGWDPGTGLSDMFGGLAMGMSFKIIPGYSLVNKLISDGQFLYVVTQNSVDRIDLQMQNPGLGQVAATTIARNSAIAAVGPHGAFLDAVISNEFALLASTRGMIRNGNGTNVQTVTDTFNANWQNIPIPDGDGPIVQLFWVTPTQRAQDIMSGVGGNIYALRGYYGKNQAQINRFFIAGNSPVSDDTVQPFPDIFLKNFNSLFVNFGQVRSKFLTDGAFGYSARNQVGQAPTMISIFPVQPAVVSGHRFIGASSLPVDAGVRGASQITALSQNSASGTALAMGDFGARVNE